MNTRCYMYGKELQGTNTRRELRVNILFFAIDGGDCNDGMNLATGLHSSDETISKALLERSCLALLD